MRFHTFIIFCFNLYCKYSPGQISRIILTSFPLIFLIFLSLFNTIYVCTNALGMPNVITYFLCFVSITPVVMIEYDAANRLLYSSSKIYDLWVLPLVQMSALKVLFISLFKKSRLLYFSFIFKHGHFVDYYQFKDNNNI